MRDATKNQTPKQKLAYGNGTREKPQLTARRAAQKIRRNQNS